MSSVVKRVTLILYEALKRELCIYSRTLCYFVTNEMNFFSDSLAENVGLYYQFVLDFALSLLNLKCVGFKLSLK